MFVQLIWFLAFKINWSLFKPIFSFIFSRSRYNKDFSIIKFLQLYDCNFCCSSKHNKFTWIYRCQFCAMPFSERPALVHLFNCFHVSSIMNKQCWFPSYEIPLYLVYIGLKSPFSIVAHWFYLEFLYLVPVYSTPEFFRWLFLNFFKTYNWFDS